MQLHLQHKQQKKDMEENWIPDSAIAPCLAKSSTDWVFSYLAFKNCHIIGVFPEMAALACLSGQHFEQNT